MQTENNPLTAEEAAKSLIPEHPYPDMEYPAAAITKIKRQVFVEGAAWQASQPPAKPTAVDGEQIVYVPTPVSEELPPIMKPVFCMQGEDLFLSMKRYCPKGNNGNLNPFWECTSRNGNEDFEAVTHWLKRVSLSSLISQPTTAAGEGVQPVGEELYRWVKASDRLPKEDNKEIIFYYKWKDEGPVSGIGYDIIRGFGMWLRSPYYNAIQWLEPLPHTQPSAAAAIPHPWVLASIDPPPESTAVLGYSPDWMDEDYAPEGVRECLFTDGLWMSAGWNGSQDCWFTDCKTKPTYWVKMPIVEPSVATPATEDETKPSLVERFADNGAHSHWELISQETGDCLWSENIEGESPYDLKSRLQSAGEYIQEKKKEIKVLCDCLEILQKLFKEHKAKSSATPVNTNHCTCRKDVVGSYAGCPQHSPDRQPKAATPADPSIMEHTGFATLPEWEAYQKGQNDYDDLICQRIAAWDGSTNSALGKALSERFLQAWPAFQTVSDGGQAGPEIAGGTVGQLLEANQGGNETYKHRYEAMKAHLTSQVETIVEQKTTIQALQEDRNNWVAMHKAACDKVREYADLSFKQNNQINNQQIQIFDLQASLQSATERAEKADWELAELKQREGK